MARDRSSRFKRPGGVFTAPSDLSLPRAQERVQQARELEALITGDWGREAPRSALYDPVEYDRAVRRRAVAAGQGRVVYPEAARRPKSDTFPLAKRSGFVALRKLRYLNPKVVLRCAQRQVRREVLFALGKQGRHGAGVRYRRTADSAFGC